MSADLRSVQRTPVLPGLVALVLLLVALTARSQVAAGFVVAFCVFTPLERLFTLHPQRVFRRGFLTDLVHFAVTNLLIGVLFLALLLPAIGLVRAGGSLPTGPAIHRQALWLQTVEALLLAEVTHYWAHRATHRVRLLWRFHALHHSIEQLDWLASARQHPLDGAVTRALSITPLLLLGFSRIAFGAIVTLQAFAALFQHSNVRLRLGPLRWLVASPEFHHWHHSSDPVAYNKNFAGGLPLLDLLFGTAYLPGYWPSSYGVRNGPPQTGYVRQLTFPWRGRAQGARMASSSRAA